MLRNALVLLPRVLHVLELDQDLRCGLDGGGARKPPRRRAAPSLAPPPPVLAKHLPRTPCASSAPSRARRCPCPRPPCTGFAASRARRSPAPHSLHGFHLKCSQMLAPPLLALARSPVLADASPPPCALRTLRARSEPPHSLPPSLPPVLAIPFPGHSLQRYPPQPTPCARPVVCTPTSRGRFPSAGAMSARAVGRDARSVAALRGCGD